MSSGRPCPVCSARGRRRAVPEGRRHLHELEAGDAFEDHRGRIRTVVELSAGRTLVSGGQEEADEVSFETFEGEEVEFEVPAKDKAEAWSPTAAVRPAA